MPLVSTEDHARTLATSAANRMASYMIPRGDPIGPIAQKVGGIASPYITMETKRDTASEVEASGGLSITGSVGDMLYNDGTNWILLVAPIVSLANPVLRHSGTAPYWEEPESC